MGQGQKILFWKDFLCGSRPLREEFPRLYDLSLLKFSSLRTFYHHWSSGVNNQSIIWRRSLRAWEESEQHSLAFYLDLLGLNSNEDKLVWVHNNNLFTSKECYLSMVANLNQSAFWKTLWKIRVPPKVLIFLWKIEHKILPINLLLSSRLHLPASCKWCGYQEESLDHLFLRCELASWCWSYLVKSCGCNYPLDYNAPFSLSSIMSCKNSYFDSRAWRILISVVLWTIWLGRNECTFRGVKCKEDCYRLIKVRAFKWFEAVNLMSSKFSNLWEINSSGALRLKAIEDNSDFWKKNVRQI